MKRFLTYILLLIATVAVTPARAQEHNTETDEAALMVSRYNASYDSLLNTYYMRKYARNNTRHNQTISVQEFDQIPDSVIIERLRNMHTVIPMTYNKEVRSYIRMYLNRMSSRLDVMLTLCEFYHPIFEEGLSCYEVPEELKYLTIVESAMNPMATSRVGAAGLWQFMYHTGKNYDLEVNSIVDDRRDPYKSTIAAAHHIHDLYKVFGDWTLAIAAYNCGAGNINKAIARSGGKRDFWQIYPYLPRETRGYIPAFIAATYVMKYYPEHGLHPRKIALPIHTDTIHLKQDAMFCYVSDFVDITNDELRTLNPQYRVDFIPASSGNYSLCVPSDKLEQLIRMEDSIYTYTADSLSRKPIEKTVAQVAPAKKGNGAVYHTVKKGDNLSKIAAKYGTTPAAIKKKNNLKSDRIREGQKLKIR